MANKLVIAAAGARKTTSLVEDALSLSSEKRILVTTYTIENTSVITNYFVQKCGCVPKNIVIMPWMTFMLRDGAKPYQNILMSDGRIKSVNFDDKLTRLKRRIRRDDIDRHYFDSSGNIVSEFLSDFVCRTNSKSGGLVADRIARVYDQIYVDEAQDLARYDLDFLYLLFTSGTNIVALCDPRQVTYMSNTGSKNSGFDNVADWALAHVKKGIFTIEKRTDSYRCNQPICDFADRLFPNYDPTTSKMTVLTGHDGVFFVRHNNVSRYVENFEPQMLRYNRTADCRGFQAVNIGMSKGQTFDRVLIVPTGPMKTYLKTSLVADAGSLEKLYVAVTRAKHSVAFMLSEGEAKAISAELNVNEWLPNSLI